MRIVKTWYESGREGLNYLKYNGYKPLLRIGKYFVVRKLGIPLSDVYVVF